MVALCKNCGATGNTKMQRRGSPKPELLLWLCLLLPGLVYSVWRWMNTYKTCVSCGRKKLVKVTPLQATGSRRLSDQLEKLAKR